LVVDEDGLISGIYNYCDRWCERCEFTARCRSFQMEQELPPVETIEDAVREVGNIFADVKEMLLQAAEERGIDLTVDEDEWAATDARMKKYVNEREAHKLGMKYAVETSKFLDAGVDWIDMESLGEDTANRHLEVIVQYMFSIGAKVHSAYHGLLDIDGYEQPDERSDPQSHANGSAKICLIMIGASINAWKNLRDDKNADDLAVRLEQLERIKTLIEADFPKAWEFVRPGFDELEAVM